MVGVIFFHKNVKSIYKERWIEKCIKSILHQDFTSFKIYELNYGDDDYSFIKKSGTKRKFDFHSSSFDNHADAMNFIITKAFEEYMLTQGSSQDDLNTIKLAALNFKKRGGDE